MPRKAKITAEPSVGTGIGATCQPWTTSRVHGAQVDARSSSGSTPLMEAAHAGEVTVVLALCEHGANVHLRNGPASSAAIHQAENCDMRCHFLRTKRPPEASLWRLPLNEEATAASRRPAPDGGACVRVLLRFGAARIL